MPIRWADIPDELAGLIAGCRPEPVRGGDSGDAVVRLHRPGTGPAFYLKQAAGACAVEALTDEADRLGWLAARLAPATVTPQILHFSAADAQAWLLTSEVPGATVEAALAGSDPADRPGIVDALAAFLRRLHALPAAACPFPADAAIRLAQARTRIDDGLVDPADFDDDRAGWSPEQVWTALQATRPAAAAAERGMVVTHGDFTLENVLFANGRVTGCIDPGRLGVADPYQDIALAWRGLAEFGSAVQQRFLAALGADPPDRARLDFHLLLDELF